MRKICLVPFILLFILGCGADQQKIMTDVAINVNEKYQDVRDQYLKTYESSPPELQKYMQKNVAPKLNEARKELLEYNSLVLGGTGTKDEQREAIIKLLVEIERMMEII